MSVTQEQLEAAIGAVIAQGLAYEEAVATTTKQLLSYIMFTQEANNIRAAGGPTEQGEKSVCDIADKMHIAAMSYVYENLDDLEEWFK